MTRLEVIAVTHRGAVRRANEDTIAAGSFLSNAHEGEPVRLEVRSDRPIACLVADGLGGNAEGARASRLAARYLADAWCRYGDPDSVVAAVQRANELVEQEASLSPAWEGMATTLAGVVLVGGQAICVNVGDSRCYRLSDGLLVQVSTDDSPTLPPDAEPGAVTTIVTQALGGHFGAIFVDPHLYCAPTASGDRFLLCSDGLTDVLPLHVVESLLAGHDDDPEPAVRAILDATLTAGGHDNISILLVTVLA